MTSLMLKMKLEAVAGIIKMITTGEEKWEGKQPAALNPLTATEAHTETDTEVVEVLTENAGDSANTNFF